MREKGHWRKLQAVKFWVLELRREEGASNSKACFIANFRSWEHVHTHRHKVWLQYKIYTRWCNPTYICFPCTWVLRLTSRLCTPACFWAYRHAMSSPYNSFGRRRKRKKEKKHKVKEQNFSLIFCTPSLQSSWTRIVLQRHHRMFCFGLLSFRSMFVVVLFDVHHYFVRHLS